MREWRDQTDLAEAWDRLGQFTGALAFNIGGNIGQAAHHLAARFDCVLACEPCQESFEVLEREAVDNIVPVFTAVTDHVGTLVLTESAESILSGQLTTGPGLSWGETIGEREVACTTVDALTVRFGPPDLIQVDTEGHEVFVLAGAKNTLAEHHPDLFIEVHRRENEAEVYALASGYRWEKFQWPDTTRYLRQVRDEHFWLAGIYDGV